MFSTIQLFHVMKLLQRTIKQLNEFSEVGVKSQRSIEEKN